MEERWLHSDPRLPGWLFSYVPLSLPPSTPVTSEGTAKVTVVLAGRLFFHLTLDTVSGLPLPLFQLFPPLPSSVGCVLCILPSRLTNVTFYSVTITKLHLWAARSMDIK